MSQFKKRLQLFSIPAFRWYVFACTLSMFGVGLGYVAITWIVLMHGGSLISVGLLMLAFWLPNIVLGPIMGVLVDRYSKKWLIFLSNTLRATLFILFGFILLHKMQTSLLYYLLMIQGAFFSLFLPAAIAIPREIVEPDDLLIANSTIDIAYEAGNIAGMGAAGLFISVFTPAGTIIINGVFFALAAGMMIFVKLRADLQDKSPKTQRLQIAKDFRLGMRYLLSKKALLLIYVVQLMVFVEFMTAPVILAPFAKTVLHTNAKQFGDIEAALSIGVIAGGLFIPWFVDKLGFMRTMLIFLGLLGLSYIGFGHNHKIYIAGVFNFLIGFCLAVWPVLITKAQGLTKLRFQGRVQSVFNSLSGIFVLLFFGLVAWSHTIFPLSQLYWLLFAIAILAMGLLWYARNMLEL